jgi:hypothetical protein
VSFITPIAIWFVFHDGEMLERSGSLVVFFAAVAEFSTLNKGNRKHILNACRVRNGETPWDFSRPANIVGWLSFLMGLIGTMVRAMVTLLFVQFDDVRSAKGSLRDHPMNR